MQSIGRYQVECELGKGAMGVVYKATDPNIGRQVALKTLRIDVHGIEADEMRRRFQNEARAAGVLNHPNIITIYDAGEDQGLFYIAMEFIPGETLAELLKKQRVLPVEQMVSIIRGVCAGLDFAHSKGIVHRDIKPANVMIAPDGTAKVMDFGIAKATGNLTNTGQVLGTPNYMSPEQVRGRALDGRTDLFSVGVVLYEMLTGEKPFAGESVTTIIYKIVNENPISPGELDASIHPGLSAIVTRALSKDPAERYQSGAELATDLANYKSYGSKASETSAGTTATGSETTSSVASASAPATAAEVAQSEAIPPSSFRESTPATQTVFASTTSVQRKSNAKAIFAVAALIVLALAGLVGAKRFLTRNAALQSERAKVERAVNEVAPSPSEARPNAGVSSVEAATQGEVNITSTPPGAKIEIDGYLRENWVTPLRAEKLGAGKHEVVLTLENYTPEKRTIEVVAGKKVSLDAKLTTTLGMIHISSDPDGADVLLNGQATGKKTPADFAVPPGNQAFTLRKTGYEDSGDTVSVEAGQNINITPKLTQLTTPFGKLGKFFRGGQEDRGLLIVRTRPRGAHVSINGVALPAMTPVRIPIKSGKYALSIEMEGFQPVKRDVVVERGKQTGLEEQLVRNNK